MDEKSVLGDIVELKAEYRTSLSELMNHLRNVTVSRNNKECKLTRSQIQTDLNINKSLFTHLLDKESKRGINEYRNTLLKILFRYQIELGISNNINSYIIGTQYEKIVDCKTLNKEINRQALLLKEKTTSILKPDKNLLESNTVNNEIHFLIYWWHMNFLFPSRLTIEKTDDKKATSHLYFYKFNEQKGIAFNAVIQNYSQKGDGDIFDTSVHIMTTGEGIENSNVFYRTQISLKISRRELKKLKDGDLIAGTYSTISKQQKDMPMSGLMICEYAISKEDAEGKIRLAGMFNRNTIKVEDNNYKKLILIQQLLFREKSTVNKYSKLKSPFKIDDLINTKDKENISYCLEIFNFSGKYILTFLNTQLEEPVIENGRLEIFINGDAKLTLASFASRDENDIEGKFSTISGGSVLLGQFRFSEKFGYPKLSFSIVVNKIDRTVLYGTYTSLGQHAKSPSVGRVRLLKENNIKFNAVSEIDSYYPLSKIKTKDIDFYDIINGHMENQKGNTPFGESVHVLDKEVLSSTLSKFKEHDDNLDNVYKDFAGTYVLYSEASQTQDGYIQAFPININSEKQEVEIRSRGRSYFGKLQYFKNGILEMYFNRTSSGSSHFMHKLFIVKSMKVTDSEKPVQIYGTSNRINRNQELRASFDILILTNIEWNNEDFKFEENAVMSKIYGKNAKIVKSIYEKNKNDSNVITVPYKPNSLNNKV